MTYDVSCIPSSTTIADNSILEAVARCSREAVIKYIWHFDSKEASAPRDVGSAVHAALSSHFAGLDKGRVLRVLVDAYNTYVDPASISSVKYTLANIENIVARWIDVNAVEKLPFDILSNEKTAVVPFNTTRNQYFAMKRDLLIRAHDNGMLSPLDHKTTGSINSPYWLRQFRLNSQFTGYVWATGIETNEIVDRIWINAIETSKLPDSSRKKCKTHGVTYAECAHLHARFKFFTAYRSAFTIAAWKTQTQRLFDIFTALHAYNDFSMLAIIPAEGVFRNACRFCDLRDFCAADCTRDAFESLLTHKKWEPWNEKEGQV